jgi:excisionase family DNA binding protein
MTEHPFMTVAEVAKALDLSEMRVYQLVRAREIPSVKLGGRIRVPRRAFDDWLDKANERALDDSGIAGA